ncbi:MAG: alanine--tRNA ligase [Acidobacteria bacterium]|nr:alanine--tRNA ligase [Acidobacteriota bacterium]
MTGDEVREKFLRYFEGHGHRILPSSSLVPANDPTLLFTNAGMNQFKDVFLGAEKRDYNRATTSQKCVRAGGKHNDLENVGYTRRHHTFFEMLGNFSFGDYFKQDAIAFAWELVTKVYGLPKERLYVTVFDDDDDAEDLWKKTTDIGPGRIFRCGAKDNFWQMGDTGPCGPCSEIFYDFGPEALEPGEADVPFPSDTNRFVEIWNLVFMQFDRDAEGNLTPLPKPSIDTGLGLERTAAVLQGKLSNFDTDLIRPIIDRAAELLGGGMTFGADPKIDTTLRIIADHSRAAAFLIHDNVLPANEGRGYVLRKIMRRALRHARLAGRDKPFLYELTGFVAEHMKAGYPEMMESVPRVARVVKEEETRYQHSFVLAERMFETETENISNGVLPGSAAFKLYDSFGLSLDEQGEMARERKLTIDHAGFEKEMNEQRSRARASWKGGEQATINPVYQQLRDKQPTKFEGYGNLETSGSTIVALLVDHEQVDAVPANTKAEIILDRTPFYAESGGQIGDQGVLLSGGDVVARVSDVQAPIRGLSVHSIVTAAPLKVGQQVEGRVDGGLRRATMRNHTATHLMHAALRRILGTHVKQAGSVVAPDRLRFDVTHYTAVDEAERQEVERLVNEEILKNAPVTTEILDLENALKTGAMALFGEKYTEKVRVVAIDGFSKELCGGTHVSRTGDIGVFKITSESSVAAGVRRLEAITGLGAYDEYRHATDTIARLAATLRVSEPLLVESVEKLAADRKSLEREVEQLKGKLAESSSGDLTANARDIKGIKVISAKLDGLDRNQMRSLADSLRNKIGSGVVVLASIADGNIALISAVTKDLAGKKVHAGKLVGAIAQEVGGRGGGRPDLAEAGGTNTGKLPAALERVYELVAEMAGG